MRNCQYGDDQILTISFSLAMQPHGHELQPQLSLLLMLELIDAQIKEMASAQIINPQIAVEGCTGQKGEHMMTEHCWSLDIHRGRCLLRGWLTHTLLTGVEDLWLDFYCEAEFNLLQFSRQFPRLQSTAEVEECTPVELSASYEIKWHDTKSYFY